MAISVPLHQLTYSFFSNPQEQWKWCAKPSYTFSNNSQNNIRPIKASVETPPFPLFQNPKLEETPADGLEPADPDFYKIGYVRSMRAYGVEFKEGPDGFGVFASKDIEPRRRAREDLMELQDPNLASTMREQQKRAREFWEKNWHSGVPLKIKRLARDPERFIWAVSIAQSRCINMQVRIGALVQDANMLIPYADMLNHSFQPNCFFHWRFKDRMLEVMVNAGQHVRRGEEMTVNYMHGQMNDMLMQRYGFSSPVNPWNVIQFSGDARIHLDSFLSVFNISGLPEEYYHNSKISSDKESFVDGAVIAAARTLPTWSDGDVPLVPSIERKAVKELQEECRQMLAEFPTTSKQDQKMLDSMKEPRRTLEAAIKYRLHRKLFIDKVIKALDIYQDRILF
ncbi:protein PLASTID TRANSCRIPTIONALLY ACTIVE 14 isoform X6 [Citrus clementina]|uniref:protein PLASTID TRANSCRIPTIONALLY ACTIVE 14 isoform X6 n=1 Tax=Citrus clementina TaxID=85681 RepID=UPI000CED4609|nr:protein PLASTID TRANSCRIPTIONALLY ACTIVE 14 isoform X6 [Citrus x clementina]